MEENAGSHYGLVNFERRKYPRIDVDLPVEYGPTELFVKQGHAANVSEGGLLLYLPERMEIGQHLAVKLFFPSEPKLEVIEAVVRVVWLDIAPMEKGWRDYRTGVIFAEISSEALFRVKRFLESLLG